MSGTPLLILCLLIILSGYIGSVAMQKSYPALFSLGCVVTLLGVMILDAIKALK